MSDKIGAWKKTVKTKNGDVEIFSFTINGVRYSMWPNKFKKEQKHPDYQITVDTYEPKQNDDKPVFVDNTGFQSTKPKAIQDDLPF